MATIIGPRYPTGPNPYLDLMLYEVAEPELPKITHSGDADHYLTCDFSLWGKALRYKLYPHCVNAPDARVLYYKAYHTEREHVEFVIGPAKLDQFATFVEKYAVAAANFYGFSGSVTKHEVNLIRLQNKLFAGQLGPALKVLKQSWIEALQDPNWVVQTLLAHSSVVAGKGRPKLPGKKGAVISTAVEDAKRAGQIARQSGASGTVEIGKYGETDALRGAINVSSMDDVTYSIQSISSVTPVGEASVAKATHRELLRQAAETARASGKKTFMLVGEQANDNFVRHAEALADGVGVKGSGKPFMVSGKRNYQVELLADKVLEGSKTDLLSKALGVGASAAQETKADAKK